MVREEDRQKIEEEWKIRFRFAFVEVINGPDWTG